MAMGRYVSEEVLQLSAMIHGSHSMYARRLYAHCAELPGNYPGTTDRFVLCARCLCLYARLSDLFVVVFICTRVVYVCTRVCCPPGVVAG